MTDLQQTHNAFGGLDGYRAVHESLSRALAEPAAQGDHAHGARAGFLLSQIAPQIQALRSGSITQALEDAGVPLEYLNLLAPYLLPQAEPPQILFHQAVAG